MKNNSSKTLRLMAPVVETLWLTLAPTNLTATLDESAISDVKTSLPCMIRLQLFFSLSDIHSE